MGIARSILDVAANHLESVEMVGVLLMSTSVFAIIIFLFYFIAGVCTWWHTPGSLWKGVHPMEEEKRGHGWGKRYVIVVHYHLYPV